MRLKDKVAIVTGAGQGIGKETALTLAREGAKVVVNDMTDRMHDVVKEIRAMGSRALGVKANVSKFDEVDEMVKKTLDEFERIDILVNNAGIFSAAELTKVEEEWDIVMETNLRGVFNCSKAALPTMMKQKSGKIVNISSISGAVIAGWANTAPYGASKAGIAGFTRALAVEVAPYGINVNAIAPSVVVTPNTLTNMGEEALKQIAKKVPLGRVAQPIDIAKVVVFLASDDSSYITGQLLVVDGGITLLAETP